MLIRDSSVLNAETLRMVNLRSQNSYQKSGSNAGKVVGRSFLEKQASLDPY